MDDNVYSIIDLDGYATEMRHGAASSLAENYDENLDDYISLQQIKNIVKEKCVGYDDQDRPLLNEEANISVYESIVTWIHNVGLAKLAAKDLIECCWDDKVNTMFFWQKESNNEQLDCGGKNPKTQG